MNSCKWHDSYTHSTNKCASKKESTKNCFVSLKDRSHGSCFPKLGDVDMVLVQLAPSNHKHAKVCSQHNVTSNRQHLIGRDIGPRIKMPIELTCNQDHWTNNMKLGLQHLCIALEGSDVIWPWHLLDAATNLECYTIDLPPFVAHQTLASSSTTTKIASRI